MSPDANGKFKGISVPAIPWGRASEHERRGFKNILKGRAKDSLWNLEETDSNQQLNINFQLPRPTEGVARVLHQSGMQGAGNGYMINSRD